MSAPLTRRRVWALALPIIFSNMSEPLVWFFDLFAAGHLAETVHASAVSLSAAAYLLLMWTFGFLRLSTGGFSAQAFGARDTVQGRAVFQRALMIALALAVFCLAIQGPFFAAADWIFALQKGAQQDLAGEFFFVRIWGAPASLAFYVVIGWLVGVQRMRWIFGLQLLLNLTNIALNLLFTFVFDWGVVGIAWASNIATYLAAAVGLAMVWRLDVFLAVPLARLFNPQRFAALMTANASLLVRSLAIEAAFIYMKRVGNLKDEVFATANTTLLWFHEIAAFGLDGFAMSVESLAGAAYGAGSVEAYRRAVRLTTEAALILAVIWSGFFLLAGPSLVNFMTDKEEIRVATKSLILFGALSPLVGVLSYQLDGIYFGLTKTAALMVSMVLSTAVFLIAAHYALVPAFGMLGLWWGYVLFMIMRTATLAAGLPSLDRLVQRRARDLREGRL